MRLLTLSLLNRYWLPVSALTFILITMLSLWPLPHLPKVPGSDKTHHFIAYTILAVPVALSRPRHWPKVLVIFIICSGIIEMIQPLVNRYGELLDFIANAGGVCCGTIAGGVLRYFTPDQPKTRSEATD